MYYIEIGTDGLFVKTLSPTEITLTIDKQTAYKTEYRDNIYKRLDELDSSFPALAHLSDVLECRPRKKS